MEFHPHKCTAIHVSRKQKPIDHQYLLLGHTLEAVNSGKYMYLHSKLKWTGHIGNIRAKSCKPPGFLHRNFHGCRSDIKATAYSTMVRPTLEYTSTVWDPYHQKTGIKVCQGDLRKISRLCHSNAAGSGMGALGHTTSKFASCHDVQDQS